MDSSSGTIFFILILLIGLVIRVILHFVDKARVEEAARNKGWQEVSVQWAPFAPGFFFEKGERHYLVNYRDAEGRRQMVWCKTSLLTGVFWRDGMG